MPANNSFMQPRDPMGRFANKTSGFCPATAQSVKSRYPEDVFSGVGRNPESIVWQVAQARNYRVDLREATAEYTEHVNSLLTGTGVSVQEDGTAWQDNGAIIDDDDIRSIVQGVDAESIVKDCAIKEVDRMTHSSDPEERIEAALSRLATNDQLRRLAHDPNVLVVIGVAENKNLSDQEEIDRLAGHDYPNIRAFIASNPHMRADTVDHLSHDPDSGVRSAIACRRDLTPVQRDRLAHDENGDVRFFMMSNDTVTDEVFDQYTRDNRSSIRGTAARVNRLSRKQEELLSQDRNKLVRAMIASRSYISPDTLQRLRSDPDHDVRFIAEMNHPDASRLEKSTGKQPAGE